MPEQQQRQGVPDEFGCLYCHNSPVLKDDPDAAGILYENKMRDASDHFRGKASSHPVGYDLTNATDTSGHLLSTFDCKNGAGVYYGEGTTEENMCAVDGIFYTAPAKRTASATAPRNSTASTATT